MATDAITKGYLEEQRTVAADLLENGFMASFGNEGERVNHGLPQPYAEVCEEPVFEVQGSDKFKDIVQSGDALFMVGNLTNLLSTCSKMQTASGIRKIFKTEAFTPDDQTVIFTWVLVRE